MKLSLIWLSTLGLALAACVVPQETEDTGNEEQAIVQPEEDCSVSLWAGLTADQQQRILAGEQVRIDDPNPAYWHVTFAQKIAHGAHSATPRGAAALFWDIPGQPSYLGSFGLVSADVLSGAGTAVEHVQITSAAQTPQGPVLFSYPELVTVTRLCAQTYESTWQVTDPNAPMLPGALSTWGSATFQHFPGDHGGALMAYSAYVVLDASVLGNETLKQALASQLAAVVSAHAQRMAQGASQAQLVALSHAVR